MKNQYDPFVHRPSTFTPPFAGYGICMYAWLGKMGLCEYTNLKNINLILKVALVHVKIWEAIKLNVLKIIT